MKFGAVGVDLGGRRIIKTKIRENRYSESCTD
jgi:hypothetical protein